MAERKLAFICLNHPHIVEWLDDDNNRDGPNNARQSIIRRIEKRVDVDGLMRQPFYRLAHAPTVNDPAFDDKYLRRDDGNFIFAHKEWLEERARRCAASAEKARSTEVEAQKKAGLDMVENMTAFVSSLQQSSKIAAQIPAAPAEVIAPIDEAAQPKKDGKK